MSKDMSRRLSIFLGFELTGKARSIVVILLGLALMLVSSATFAQTSQQQQEEQQREEQAREQQQRDEQQREQQARDEQQRAEQQREEQAREQQQRDEQQREQQARDEQQRAEQQREEQQREEQAREQQQREQQERQAREQQAREQQQEQERQRQTSASPVNRSTAASPSEESSVSGPISIGGQAPNGFAGTTSRPNVTIESHAPSQSSPPDANRAATPTQTPGPAVRTKATDDAGSTTAKSQSLPLPASGLQRRPCDKEPCAQPTTTPTAPASSAKLCTGGPCQICAPGQSPGKNNSCVPATVAKTVSATAQPSPIPPACAAGQSWNGVQCAPVGAQQCLPGQSRVGAACQPDCSLATAGAQHYIDLLRMARQDKDRACTQNPTGQQCQEADSTYDMKLHEYRTFVAGVPGTCTLPDPISI